MFMSLKMTIFPPFPLLKSFQICLTGDTMKLGVRSCVKGLSPLKFAPDFFNATKSPTTSSTLIVGILDLLFLISN